MVVGGCLRWCWQRATKDMTFREEHAPLPFSFLPWLHFQRAARTDHLAASVGWEWALLTSPGSGPSW